jgi:hypothetical protein
VKPTEDAPTSDAQIQLYNSRGRGGIGAGVAVGQQSGMGEAPDTAAAPLLMRVEDGADADWSSRPHRIALFVEPSPFASVPSPSSPLSFFVLRSVVSADAADRIMPDWIRSSCSAARTRLCAIRGQ